MHLFYVVFWCTCMFFMVCFHFYLNANALGHLGTSFSSTKQSFHVTIDCIGIVISLQSTQVLFFYFKKNDGFIFLFLSWSVMHQNASFVMHGFVVCFGCPHVLKQFVLKLFLMFHTSSIVVVGHHISLSMEFQKLHHHVHIWTTYT